MSAAPIRIALIVPFLDEAARLPVLLASLAAQERPPDRLVLVDDGSTDGSASIAAGFAAAHPYALLLRRPPRPPEQDRMARAHEWRAFTWGLARLDDPWDVVAKLDADLQLAPDLLGELERRFAADERLGIAGAYVAHRLPNGRLVRQRCPADHVEGQNRFYRRAGWAAYAYGADPVHLLASGMARMRDRPALACGVAYLGGYAAAALRREPRAEPQVRALVRREERARLIALARGVRR